MIVSVGGEQRVLEPGDRLIIGRGRESDLVVAAANCSRTHLIIEQRDDEWVAIDVNTANGTYAAGNRIETLAITGSVRLTLGQSNDTVVDLHLQTAADAGPPTVVDPVSPAARPVAPGGQAIPQRPTSSDHQVDATWWLASDGRWYPSQQSTPAFTPVRPSPHEQPPVFEQTPVQPVAAPPNAAKRKPGVFIAAGAALVLGLGVVSAVAGNDGDDRTTADTIVVAVEATTPQALVDPDPEPDPDPGSEATTPVPEPAVDNLGTTDNPIPFGQSHSRDPSFLGAAWTVSIDEVRTEGVLLDPFWADEGETRTCLAILGSATLDSLDSDELTSNMFDFPTPNLIVNGSLIDSAITECDVEGLRAEGYEWVLDVSLAAGGSTKWFQTYLVETTDYDTVAIESTVYGE